ncbi:hypothetical protein Pfo_026493, partial [Paulownia fortunei]
MMCNLDLNNPPHSEDVNTNLELGLPSSQLMAYQNDDVTIISRRNFELAVSRSRRNRMTMQIQRNRMITQIQRNRMMQIQYAEARPQRGHTGFSISAPILFFLFQFLRLKKYWVRILMPIDFEQFPQYKQMMVLITLHREKTMN